MDGLLIREFIDVSLIFGKILSKVTPNEDLLVSGCQQALRSYPCPPACPMIRAKSAVRTIMKTGFLCISVIHLSHSEIIERTGCGVPVFKDSGTVDQLEGTFFIVIKLSRKFPVDEGEGQPGKAYNGQFV